MTATSGTVAFLADEFRKNIVLEVTADDAPELEAQYNLRIVSVDGGADVDSARNNVTFKIRLVEFSSENIRYLIVFWVY